MDLRAQSSRCSRSLSERSTRSVSRNVLAFGRYIGPLLLTLGTCFVDVILVGTFRLKFCLYILIHNHSKMIQWSGYREPKVILFNHILSVLKLPYCFVCFSKLWYRISLWRCRDVLTAYSTLSDGGPGVSAEWRVRHPPVGAPVPGRSHHRQGRI